MKIEEIKKELDKYEIPHTAGMDKPSLQALLDSELAKRASGNDTGEDPDIDDLLDTDDPDEVAPPVLTQEQRSKLLKVAQVELAEAEEAQRKATEVAKNAQKIIAENLPATLQADLAQCNKQFQHAVKNENAVKGEMEKLTARFKQEAEEILATDDGGNE